MARRVNHGRAVLMLLAAIAMVAVQLTVPPWAPRAAAADPPAPGGITLSVMSARSVNTNTTGTVGRFVQKGDLILKYKWLINQDDTGNPGTAANPGTENCLPESAKNAEGASIGSINPAYADTCQWPSVRKTSGQAPVIAQGNQSDLNATKALTKIPAGKYLISVLADGFKIDGQHFTVADGQDPFLADGTTANPAAGVTVQMNPTPLPLTTLRIQVFNDSTPVDATYEVGAEDGLAGFTAHLADVFGTVGTDYYTNPLCTTYMHTLPDGTLSSDAVSPNAPIAFDDAGKAMVDPASIGKCVSDATGEIVIPNMGPNRFGATITPPVPTSGQAYQWVQTTNLEGGHDFDVWSQEGATGYDTEQTKGAELVPSVQFGFVRTQALSVPTANPPTGEIKGVVVAGLPYIGGQGGQPGPPEPGLAGAKIEGPIKAPWVALSDLGAGDQQIYVGRGDDKGAFDIKNVPNGTYQLTMWDDDQDYIIYSVNVEVAGGALTDVGTEMLVGWFTHIKGRVFIDTNGNGKRDVGEDGVPTFALTVRERDNTTMDQFTNTATTDDKGNYDIRETYPLGKWLVLEAFNTRYETTGITYRAANEKSATTKLGSLVDLSFLPIIGLGAQIDWGVQPYVAGTNGGIVGTVSYDTTRNELDPAQAATESYSPGIPGVGVTLHEPVPCTVTAPADVANQCLGGKEIVPLSINGAPNPDTQRGALVKGKEVQAPIVSEAWAPPRGCTARDYKGTPLTDQQALPQFGAIADRMCVESPMMGVAVGPSDTTDPTSAGQTVNGNYGFGDLAAGDYIVSVDIPTDPVDGKPMYKATAEEDVNVFDGDTYLPQQNYPPATPAVAADAGNATVAPIPHQPPAQAAGIISPCAGPLHKVAVTNPAFIAGGGSPFEGQDKPSCADKLVTVRNGQATAPNFNLFTDVPLPTHFWGVTLNDLGITLDKRSVNYGEAQGLPFVPVGLYDSFGRLSYTAHTDFNGLYEALVPSTDTFNCPVPAGPCPNMYRFTGNDPGQPGAENPDYNPRFRTISTNFQAWPGLYTVTDEAPTQVASTVLSPDTTVANPTMCDLGLKAPQIFSVDKPFVRSTDADRTVTVKGIGFGDTTGTVTFGTGTVTATSWSNTTIVFTVPATQVSGSTALSIQRADGVATFNGLTIQVAGLASAVVGQRGKTIDNPRVFEVGPNRTYSTVQAAVDAARPTESRRFQLVVVYPGTPTTINPRGEYNENLIVPRQIKIQGVGPGGFQDSTYIPGSILDGGGFNPDNAAGTAWITKLGGLRYDGLRAVPDAAVVTVVHQRGQTSVPDTWPLSIDGFTITGGAQSDVATNINIITGGVKTPYGATGALITQGGGVYVHSTVKNMRVTDNIILGNGGAYGGAVRVGTPYVKVNTTPLDDNNNTGFVLSHNQIRDNGGTNLAGGVGIFVGNSGYSIDHNAICGNHSSEYGGAITAFGYNGSRAADTSGGTIDHNRIWFNQSYDEGGAITIAGELPADPNGISEGTGPVTIDANVIQANLANDDGGGIRLLQTSGSHVTQAGTGPLASDASRRNALGTIDITNNTIANNVSAHEGGGLALDDAAFVNIVNNTIAKNLTTATAVTSNGFPAPAGLSTAANSNLLQAKLATFNARSAILKATGYSKPTLLNNVFSDNRAGTYRGGVETGITAADANYWDLGAADGSDLASPMEPVGSLLQSGDTASVVTGPGFTRTDAPGFDSTYDVAVNILGLRTNPAFRQAVIVAQILPPSLIGSYHLNAGAFASAKGLASTTTVWGTPSGGLPPKPAFQYTVTAPPLDIDGQARPVVTGTPPTATSRYDAGSDQRP